MGSAHPYEEIARSEKTLWSIVRLGNGDMAMKCPSCGAENQDTATYCEKCAVPLEPTQKVSGDSNNRKRVRFIVAVIVVSATVILAGFIGAFYLIPPRSNSIVITDDISLPHNRGQESHEGFVKVAGLVYNSGNADGICTLNFTVTDTRGWNVSGSDVFRVPAGGSYHISHEYAWPQVFNGKNVSSDWTIDPYFEVFKLTARAT